MWWLVRATLIVSAAWSVGCPLLVRPARPASLRRMGLDRIAIPYPDPHAVEKRVLFERINRDRAQNGSPPLAYEPRAALVGDQFCLDAVLTGASGHWDTAGRAPYLRWGLAQGVDFHEQNAARYSDATGSLGLSLTEILLLSHQRMMAEIPPDDGHRRTVLDPTLTHVGIGMASVGGEFRMTEEFTRVAVEWVEVPAAPLSASSMVRFSVKPLAGWTVDFIEIRFEPLPAPLPLFEINKRRLYSYPPVIQTFQPRPPRGYLHRMEAGSHEFARGRDGRVALSWPLAQGPGHYFVVCHARRLTPPGGPPLPVTAALVTALPD